MSKIDSRKELTGVYRRCLSALNQSFKLKVPSSEKCRKFEAQVASEAKGRVFGSSKERENWIRARYEEFYNAELSRLFKDPLATLKAQIKAKMEQSI